MTSIDTGRGSGADIPTLIAFRWVPEMVRGLVRDIRVRWALEEAGMPYDVRPIALEDKDAAAYRALQPFGQVPVYEDGDLTLFESGAIVHHIAAQSRALMPQDEAGRTRTLMWMFAALNSVEPPVQMLAELDLFSPGEAWARERRPALVARVETRLGELDRELEDREYLLDRFTAGDLLLTTVLRNLRHTDLIARFPALSAHFDRCNARPASRKAMADHLASFG